MKERRVVIFCSASDTIDPKYNEAAREVVRALHALNCTVVSGGGFRGTMGAITDESIRVGGRHIAVLPRFMQGLENPGIKEVIWTETMSERKECMRSGADAAIALPGGIGTLDEFAETHTLSKLGKFGGELFLLNLDGYYDPYLALLDHYVLTGMMDAHARNLVHSPRTPEELIAYFK